MVSAVNNASTNNGVSSSGRCRTPMTTPIAAMTRIAMPSSGCSPRSSCLVSVAGNSTQPVVDVGPAVPVVGEQRGGQEQLHDDDRRDERCVRNEQHLPRRTDALDEAAQRRRRAVGTGEGDQLQRRDDHDEHDGFAPDVERDGHQHAEHDELQSAAPGRDRTSGAPGRTTRSPPRSRRSRRTR